MNRWGYLALILLIVALGVYVFTPLVPTGDNIALWHGDPPDSFTILDPDLKQEAANGMMLIRGCTRVLDGEKNQRFWGILSQVPVPAKTVISAVAAQQLGAYGIDQLHGVITPGKTLLWGESGDHGYLWDGTRILTISLPDYRALVQAAQRLDEPKLLYAADSIDRLTVGDLTLGLRDGTWRDLSHPQRPTLSTRMGRLLSWIVDLTLDRFEASPVSGTPVVEMSFSINLAGKDLPHHLAVYRGPDSATDAARSALVVIDDLPAQPISLSRLASMTTIIADLHRDWLLDVSSEVVRSRVTQLDVVSSTSPSFTVTRREGAYRVGDTHWEISWQGGEEDAAEDTLVRILGAVCDLAVDHADPGPELAPASPFRKIFHMTMQGGEAYTINLDGLNVWTRDFHGRLSRPSTLSDIQPAELLDRSLLIAAPERICKLQRIATSPPLLKEVVTRDDNGTWMRTYPVTAPVDAVAIGRLTRALCESVALSARLTTDEDRAALPTAPLVLDLRLAPLALGAPRMDISNERDTVPDNRGFSFYQDASHIWRAVDVEGGVAYVVSPELVELLRQPLQSDALYPLVPSLVTRIAVTTADNTYTLNRSGESWSLSAAGGSAQTVDPLEVRRYLRTLSELGSAQRFPDREAVLPARAALVVTCTMPTVDGNELLLLTMGAPDAQGAAVSVSSNVPGAALPQGQALIDAATAQALLAPRSRFLLSAAP